MSVVNFVGVDEMTCRIAKTHRFTIEAETWGGVRLVRVTVETDPLSQYSQQIYLRTPTAIAAGHALIDAAAPNSKSYGAIVRPAMEKYLRANGWLPSEEDWTPPEDRGNPWGFERAVEEQQRREASR